MLNSVAQIVTRNRDNIATALNILLDAIKLKRVALCVRLEKIFISCRRMTQSAIVRSAKERHDQRPYDLSAAKEGG